MSSDTKHKPNYYIILPTGQAMPTYIKDIEAAKKLIMDMEENVKLLKIKRK